MAKEYTPFPISNFRVGFDEAVEPWLLPREAYQVVENAHMYRGVAEKINGYELYTRMSYRTAIKLTPDPDGSNVTFVGTFTGQITSTDFFIRVSSNNTATAQTVFTYDSDSSSFGLLLKSTSDAGSGAVNIFSGSMNVSVIFATPPPSIVVGGVQYNPVTFYYDSFPDPPQPIMAIKPYYLANGSQEVVVCDTRRAGEIEPIMSPIVASSISVNNSVVEIPHQVQTANITHTAFNGIETAISGTLPAGSFPLFPTGSNPGVVSFVLYSNVPAVIESFTDNGMGKLIGTLGSTGFINYLTGQWVITFMSAPAATSTMNASVCAYGNVFTGDFTNFFSTTNYQNLFFLTNNVDFVRYYDGVCLMILNTNTILPAINVFSYVISKCLHVEVLRERLLLIAPTVNNVPILNTIYWSQTFNPLDFTNNKQLPATTSEQIKAYAIINSDMIVRFSNSERIFRYTGDAFAPFRWDSTNMIWRNDASYSAINYDSYFTSVGLPGIVGSDGVNVRRVDELIPDFTDPFRVPQQTPALFMNQTSIGQCYGERFDDLKEGWLCYRSAPAANNGIGPSDNVLAFNYTDDTYSVYTFPFSCIGFGTIITVPTWGTDFRAWDDVQDTWGSFTLTPGALIDLAGDQFGNVFEVDSASTLGSEQIGIITGVSNAAAAVVTSVAHGLNTGAQIVIQNVEGLDEVNNIIFVVTRLTADTFSIPINTTGFDAYIANGNWFTAPVVMNVITKNFNPFIEEGQLARFGYLDLFMSSNDDTTIRVQFYADDMLDQDYDTFYQESSITLTATGKSKVWKRIYVGAVAQEHTIRIYQNLADFDQTNLNQPIRIHAIVPYFKAAGRIFQ